ncbi:MAG: glycosyltransferase [Terriglobales bacterium]
MTTLAPELAGLKVALVHFWHVRRGGAERVLEEQARIFPHADLYFLVADSRTMAPSLREHRIRTSFLQRWPGSRRHHRFYLPLYPLALESFDLSGYDLVISNESGPAKGVITGPSTCHLCYCHTPMRYIWEMTHEYRRGMPGGWAGRGVFGLTCHYMRQWDLATAARVDHFVANCENVARRVQKHYRRKCDVIYPPVLTREMLEEPVLAEPPGDYYLVVSRLVAYKRIDLAVQACRRLGRRLLIIGGGEEEKRLRAMAGPGIEFLGEVGDEEVRGWLRSCRALIFPGEEDFGYAPVEAQASGRPIIAFGRGGVLETVRPWGPGTPVGGASGVLFFDATVESLVSAVERFESVEDEWRPAVIRAGVLQFDSANFRRRLLAVVAEQLGVATSGAARTSAGANGCI